MKKIIFTFCLLAQVSFAGEAEMELAYQYLNGNGTDIAKARDILTTEAYNGNVDAMFNLALLYTECRVF